MVNSITISREIKDFIDDHTVLCAMTLGLAIVAFAIKTLCGRVVTWLQESFGTTKKTADLGQDVIKAIGSNGINQAGPTDAATKISEQGAPESDKTMQAVQSILQKGDPEVKDSPKQTHANEKKAPEGLPGKTDQSKAQSEKTPPNPMNLTAEEMKTLKAFKAELNTLQPNTSYVYIDVAFNGKNGNQYAPGWHTQQEISEASGFTSMQLQQNAEKGFGPFLFATSFANAHDHIEMLEPQIVMPSPFPNASPSEKIEFHNVEFYYQFIKRIILLSEGKETQESLLKDIANVELFRPVNGPATAQGYGNAKKLSPAGWQFFEKHKVAIMTGAIFAKFSQHPLLSEMLKATDPHTILQLKTDPIWGPGLKGDGQNLLGVCLMVVRKALIEGKTIEPFDIQSELKKQLSG